MDVGEARRIFILAKRAEGVSDATVHRYSYDLQRFLTFVVDKEIFDIRDIAPEVIREYFIYLKDNKMKNVTIHIHFRILRTFFLFLFREDYITNNPMKHIKPPKCEQKEMRTFTAKEISKILNSYDRNTFFGLRNYCIMATFFSTGIRKSELRNILLSDVNITTDLIRITKGKGNKERFVPIGRTLRQALLRYLRMRKEFINDDFCLWLFPSKYKNRLSIGGLNELFRKLKSDLGLTGEKISAHTWRHSFAKLFLLNNGDIFSLQKILGHSDIATTKGYLNLNDQEVKIQHAKFNPLDNKDWML